MNLSEIVKTAAAVRLRQRLLPEGGPGDKVFPATYSGGVYCWEQRRIDGQSVSCVLLDSVASQANRFEEGLSELAETKAIDLPRFSVKFDGDLADLGEINTLAAPHRVFDAILRDSNTKDGKPFFKTDLYKQMTACNVRNATALFANSPSALLFGCWDSTGAAGGLGNKFARAITSEIVAVNAEWGATQGGIRQDPLGISSDVEISIEPDGDWAVVGKSSAAKKDRAKGTRPSEINHGNILLKVETPPTERVFADGTVQTHRLPLKGGVTADYALQTTVLSLTALRRLRFPVVDKIGTDHAARTVLAALGLVAITTVRERGYWLRSRCGLVADGAQDLEVVQADGTVSSLKIDSELAISAYKSAIEAAQRVGLPWSAEPVELSPQQKLIGAHQQEPPDQGTGGLTAMLAIEIEFLMGRVIAAQWEERKQIEWPPHPQRLFSAMVAAYGELDLGPSAEAALKWFESLPPPEIRADLAPSIRTSPSYFVPVNDEAVKAEKGRADFRHVLERRNRQERFFPAAIPDDPVVVFQWPVAPDVETHRETLKIIVESVTYLGHSSSPIRACMRSTAVAPTLCPSPDGDYVLRVPATGRFDRLANVHRLRQEDETVQPPLGRTQPYGRPIIESTNVFSSDALVLAFENGPKLGLDSSLPLMQHLRHALMAHLGSSAPEMLTGHDPTGGMSRDAHLSLVPLAFINSRRADGSLKGVALVLPRGGTELVRRRLRSALSRLGQLHLGPLGSISIRLIERSVDELESLNFGTYTKSSDHWASVTPVVLDRHPKKKGPDAESIVRSSCEKVGLPFPREVFVGPISAIAGVPTVHEFHGRSKQVDNRIRHHVVIRFNERIRGPVLLGAGRFIGLGVCVPFKPTGEL